MASFSTHRALGTKRRVLGCLLALGALMLVPTGGRAAAASGPDSHQQPLIDGCQRSDAFQLGLSTPEWVYVNRSDILPARAAGDRLAGTKTVDGVVGDIHPAGDDLYVNHDYNDLDIDVAVDPQFANVVATANQQSPPEIGTEWEATRIPTWAWPQVGDRVRESGS